MQIKIELSKNLKPKPEKVSGFGKIFTDHMFVADYYDGGWHDEKIVPYAPFMLDPSTSVLHYGQGVFEGLKAYRDAKTGKVRLFRPRDNFARMATSCERVCIPSYNVDDALAALEKLIEIERDWIPTQEGTSLYIRPCIIATDNSLGVHAAKTYKFFIILSPSGAYYSKGFSSVKLYVEREYVRACVGGTGAYKVIGNYAASLLAAQIAESKGYDQVLWLDSRERKYVEEVGSMNIFFIIDNKAVTPMLNGSILAGVTRFSVIDILKDMGIEVQERKISVDELTEGAKSGALTEAFGTGTAAVISPVDTLCIDDKDFVISKGAGEIATRLNNALTGIQTGKIKDIHNWVKVFDF